ncbi:SAV_2336 N-terminal domain-related protein [Streptomyces tailanensis]|uniref:SAV_2336 N-terminal domain-related protein n=1 Tax=Streptomyces tailanensis TaxID=2569858 RepID=UPI00122E55EA|nr:SAV_2336 N-terminal domain-related protein [Streptomyces tailanensis]
MSRGTELLGEVLGVLKGAGHDLDPQEVLDTLWLASRLSPDTDDELPLQRVLRPTASAAVAPVQEQPTAPEDEREEPDGLPSESDLPSLTHPELHAAPLPPLLPDTPLATLLNRGRPALPVLVPEEKALRDELVVGRALRPLKQKRPSPWREELDETATAALLAETRLPDVVMGPTRERWLHLVVLVDDGLSMLLWHRLTSELLTAMRRLGAFRSIVVRGIDTRSARAPALHGKPFDTSSSTLSPATLRDPSGQTLVLLVSDGMGAAWRHGAVHDLLLDWATRGPVAVLHTLPPDLWAGSGIQADRWQATTRRPGGANTSWEISDRVLPRKLARFTGVPVPVLEPTPESLGAWTRLLTSPGITVELPLLARPGRQAPVTASREVGSLQHFRDAASPQAYRLAAHLAAVSPVSVPVMRLVQSAVPWQARTDHLAEVFLGGLIHPFPAPVPGPLPAKHRIFDFTEECKSALLDSVPSGELLRTSRRIGRRLEQLAGRSPDFPAWLAHPEGADRLPAAFPSFTTVERRLMARFGVTVPAPTVPTPSAPQVPRPQIWHPLAPQDPANLGPYALRGRRQGGRTIVYLALDDQGQEVALRTVRPELPASTARLLATEAEALRRMNGRYAPALLATDLDGRPPWIAMQLFPSTHGSNAQPPRLGELLDTGPYSTGPFDILISFVLAWHLATALGLCHLNGLAPTDLSPDSVVVLERSVLLTGLSDCSVDGDYHGSGAPPTPQDNILALGRLLQLISSRPRKPLRGVPDSMHLWQGDTWQPLRELVLKCLSQDPADRPTATEVADRMARYIAIAQAMRGGGPAPRTHAPAPAHWKASLPPLEPRAPRDTPEPRLGRRPLLRPAGNAARVARDALRAAVRRPLTHSRRVTLLGAHPNCGRSTVTVVLGAILTAVRGEPILALDGAPTMGDLHTHLTRRGSPPRGLSTLPPDADYEEIRRHTSLTSAGLEVLAYRPLQFTPSLAYADEYRWALSLAARHYPVVLTDLSATRVDESADVVLELTDRLVVCCTTDEESVDATVRLLAGLRELGRGTLADEAVAVVTGLGGAKQPTPDHARYGALRQACAATVFIPFDPHLFEHRRIDLARLRERTVDSYLDLAARVVSEQSHAD